MKTYRELKTRGRSAYEWDAENHKNMIVWPPVVVVLLAVMALSINTIATATNHPDPENHPGPVPTQVTQLSDDSYLIASESGVGVTDICKGGYDGDFLEDSRRIPSIGNALYVECTNGQTWNSRATTPSFSEAAELTARHPGWWIPVLAAFTLALVYPLISLINETIHYPGYRKAKRAEKKRAAEEAKAKMNALAARRDELVEAWSKNLIEDDVFDAKMGDLVRQGLPRSK